MPRISKWMGDTMESLVGSRMPLLKVVETSYLSPNVKKIRFHGDLSKMNDE